MRPQDIAILVKVYLVEGDSWYIKDLANEMYISQSEFSESLNRSRYTGLLDDQKQKVMTRSFYEFLVYGLPFIYPQRPNELTRGIPTAHSHPAFNKIVLTDVKYVWPDDTAKEIGYGIEPFYANQVKAVKNDADLYLILSLIEMLRVGKTREVNFAKSKLKELFSIGA